MIGRKVRSLQMFNDPGVVIKWEPIGAHMCDAFVRHESGKEIWHGSTDLRPIDDLGPLPSRREAQSKNREETLGDLKVIRDNFIRDFNKPWPGCEHGKVTIGNALNEAIERVSKE
jgi:hypothetical protein